MSTANKANILHRNPERDLELIQKIGSGTYGEVYKARVKASGALAAVKVINIEAGDDFDIIQQEIILMQDCRHVNIVQYIGSYLRRDKLWIAMEYCGGGSLQDIYHVTGPLYEGQIGAVCTEMLKGLGYLHTHGKIHRDIKGANVLLTTDGDVKLADFGVGAQISATINKRNSFIGTPYWMAPEVAAVERTGGYDQQCDVWAVGIVAIELAELQPPLFDLHPMRALYLISKRNYTPPNVKDKSRWSVEMRDFIKTALTKNPKKRPACEKLLTHSFCAQKRAVRRLLQELLQRYANVKGRKPFKFQAEEEEEEEEAKKRQAQPEARTVRKRIQSRKKKKGKEADAGGKTDNAAASQPKDGVQNSDQKVEDEKNVDDSELDKTGTFVVRSSQVYSNADEGTLKAIKSQTPASPTHSEAPPPPIPPRPPVNGHNQTTEAPPPVPPRPSQTLEAHGADAPPPLPPRRMPSGKTATSSAAFMQETAAKCFTKIFNECPLTIACAASWTHPDNRNHYIIFASNEGIYSLNLDETVNVEMVQVYSRPCSWLYVIRNILVSVSGSPANIYMHNLMSLHAKQGVENQYVPGPKGVAYTTRVPDTQGVLKCCVVHNPYNSQIYLCVALADGILLLQWYEPLQKFMIVQKYYTWIDVDDVLQHLLHNDVHRKFQFGFPTNYKVFEPIVASDQPFPLICLEVGERPDGSLVFHTLNLKATEEWTERLGPGLDVKTFSQLEKDVIMVAYENKVKFVNIAGYKKVIKGHVTDLVFDQAIENTVCLPGSVLTFNKHGIQGKSLLDSQVTAQFSNPSKVYRLLGADRIVVMESRIPSKQTANLHILVSN